jgi:hypothetical protein
MRRGSAQDRLHHSLLHEAGAAIVASGKGIYVLAGNPMRFPNFGMGIVAIPLDEPVSLGVTNLAEGRNESSGVPFRRDRPSHLDSLADHRLTTWYLRDGRLNHEFMLVPVRESESLKPWPLLIPGYRTNRAGSLHLPSVSRVTEVTVIKCLVGHD